MKQAVGHPVTSDMRARPEIGGGADRGEKLTFLGIRESLCCPVNLLPLEWSENESMLTSSDGARRYPVVDGIPCLFAPNEWPEGKADVTDMVKSFYEETPFPNYDDLDGRESLLTKARRGVFARLLDAARGTNIEPGLHDNVFLAPIANAWKEAWQITEQLIVATRDEVVAGAGRFLIVSIPIGIQAHPDPGVRRNQSGVFVWFQEHTAWYRALE